LGSTKEALEDIVAGRLPSPRWDLFQTKVGQPGGIRASVCSESTCGK
jgi:hypothetical protein